MANQHSDLDKIVNAARVDVSMGHDGLRGAYARTLIDLFEQLETLRAAVQKELDYMDGFPDVEDGSPLALVIESLRLALSNPATCSYRRVPDGACCTREPGHEDTHDFSEHRAAPVPASTPKETE